MRHIPLSSSPFAVCTRTQAPFDPQSGSRNREHHERGREVWVKIRASQAERADWHAKVRSVRFIAVGSGAPVGWAGAHLDGRARELERERTPRAGADRFEPEPDRPLGQYPQGERRGAGGGRASGRHRAGARHFDRQWGTAMMIKFLARGTGSAGAAADYLTREKLPAHGQDPGPGRSQSAAGQSTPKWPQWPPWPMRFSSSISTRRASSPGHRRTTRAMRKLAAWWPSSRKTAWAAQIIPSSSVVVGWSCRRGT